MKKRTIGRLGAVAAAVMSLGFATPAVAAGPTPSPSGDVGSCNLWKSGGAPWGGSAYCSGLAWGDEFRVKLTCINSRGATYNVYGPWKHTNNTSSATCSSDPNVGVLTVTAVFSA